MTNKVKLGEIVKLKKGRKVDFSSEASSSAHRFIQINDLRHNDDLKYTSDEKAVLVSVNDVLIAWDGANAGTVGYHLQGAIGSTITALSITDNFSSQLHPEFLGLFLKSKSHFLRERATGATIPHLSRDVLLSLQVSVRPREEQEKIMSTIRAVDNVIKLREEQLEIFDVLVKSRYSEEVVA